MAGTVLLTARRVPSTPGEERSPASPGGDWVQESPGDRQAPRPQPLVRSLCQRWPHPCFPLESGSPRSYFRMTHRAMGTRGHRGDNS